jgi:hypothetical protein
MLKLNCTTKKKTAILLGIRRKTAQRWSEMERKVQTYVKSKKLKNHTFGAVACQNEKLYSHEKYKSLKALALQRC